MLPVIASMIMGGLAKQSTSQMPAGNSGGNNNPLAEIIEQMMKQGGLGGMMGGGMPGGGTPAGNTAGEQAAPQQQQNPFDNNPLGKVLQDMFGGGAAQQQTQGPSGANPWGKILEDMLGGGGRQEAQPEGSPAPDGGPKNPYGDLFGKMFETGRQQRDDYQKGVESIFEQFRKGMDR
jgi:hypothetical protein